MRKRAATGTSKGAEDAGDDGEQPAPLRTREFRARGIEAHLAASLRGDDDIDARGFAEREDARRDFFRAQIAREFPARFSAEHPP